MSDALTSLPDDGLAVPLQASFSGFTWVNHVVFGKNNLNPSLVLYPDRVVSRVIFSAEHRYDQIARVEMAPPLFRNSRHVVFTWKGESRTFIAAARDDASLVLLVRALQGRAPLGPRALALLG